MAFGGPEYLLAVIYTSGTTGAPKGVEHTHRNILNNMATLVEVPKIADGFDNGDLVSYLPDAHTLNRVWTHDVAASTGSTITTLADHKRLGAVLPKVRPTILLAVPMFWYKIDTAVSQIIEALPDIERMAERQALETGKWVARCRIDGVDVHGELAAAHTRAREAVLDPALHRLGLDRVRFAVTGAAPIAADMLELISALGVPCSEAGGRRSCLRR